MWGIHSRVSSTFLKSEKVQLALFGIATCLEVSAISEESHKLTMTAMADKTPAAAAGGRKEGVAVILFDAVCPAAAYFLSTIASAVGGLAKGQKGLPSE